MLAAPKVRKASRMPTILVVLAIASAVSYFAFFRPTPAPAAKAPPAVAQAPARPALRSAAEPREGGPVLPPPAVSEPPAPRIESKPEPKKAELPVVVNKVEPPPPLPVKFVPPPRTIKNEIDDLCAEGKWHLARAKLAAAFSNAIGDPERIELSQAGLRISRELLQEKPDDRDVELYEIQQGDTLDMIARKFKSLNGVKGAIMYVNNYKENAILRAGRKVRVPRGTWSVLVDKSLFKLWILYEGAPFKAYTITIGAPAKETPVAKFVTGGKNPKPAWWPPADTKIKGPVPYGDPQNPLGEWWISLEHDIHHGIGIHGTNDPGSIGSKASNGCVRMLNEEVGEVAALAFKGMIVTIVD